MKFVVYWFVLAALVGVALGCRSPVEGRQTSKVGEMQITYLGAEKPLITAHSGTVSTTDIMPNNMAGLAISRVSVSPTG